MSALYRNITIIYTLLLTGAIGASLFAGAAVAPVIFNSKLALGSAELSRFQEGLIMTENFVRLSYPLAMVCLFSFAFELHSYFKRQTDWIALISMALMVATGLMFSFYFVPEIVHLQSQGPEVTQSPLFASIHKTSEISFKITAISGVVLAYRNLIKLSG